MKKYILSIKFIFLYLALSAQSVNIDYLRHDGIIRTFIVKAPVDWQGEQLPLIINLHGFLMTNDWQRSYTEMDKLADTAHCIVIYPQGIDRRWNSGTFFGVSSDVDDVGFIGKLIDYAISLYHADASRVYLTGYSAGGFMCYKMACDVPNRIAAIVPVVASMVYENYNSCVPSRNIAKMIFNGNEDPVTSYSGIPGNFPSIPTIISFWRQMQGCNGDTLIIKFPNSNTTDGSQVEQYIFQGCDQPLIFNKIINGGHTWSGTSQFLPVGNTNQDISVNNDGWNFFKDKSIPVNVVCDTVKDMEINKTGNIYTVSWTSMPDINKYYVQYYDTTMHYNEVGDRNTFTFSSDLEDVRISVGTECNSTHKNWTFMRGISVSTAIGNYSAQRIAIYPNPVSNQYIYLNCNNLQYRIYNMMSERVAEGVVKNSQIEVSNLLPGNYSIVLHDNTRTYVSNFIKY